MLQTPSMNTSPTAVEDFARRLIALEAARVGLQNTEPSAARRVCDRLLIPLAKLAGEAGASALLSRAVALAEDEKARNELLSDDDPAKQIQSLALRENDGALNVIHVMKLLVTFIGEPLTRQLVCGIWPEAVRDERVVKDAVEDEL